MNAGSAARLAKATKASGAGLAQQEGAAFWAKAAVEASKASNEKKKCFME
ncbi:hypothetical protein GCM10028821_03120 [Hymenobacter jeollabukensis]